MAVSFIPLFVLFVVALTSMLVGLRLSPRTFAADQPEIEDMPYRHGARQERPSSATLVSTIQGYRQSVSQAVVSREYKQTPKLSYYRSTRRHPKWLLSALGLGLIFSISLWYLCRIFLSPVIGYYTPIKPYTPPPQLPQGVSVASKALKRLAQLDPGQYSSQQEYQVWAASACSTTAMTEVINAYGHNYRITDILHVEISQSAISAQLGLLNLNGIDRTVAQFGFSTVQLGKAPLDSLISLANNGWPIIADFPPGGNWPTGHFVVVTGGNSSTVFLADSSLYDFTSMPRQRFLQDWGGFAVVVVPKGQSK